MSIHQFISSRFTVTQIDGHHGLTLMRRLCMVLAGSVILASCASLTPVGNTPNATGNVPTYPSGYGVPVTERTLSQRLLDRSIEHTASVNIKALDPNLSAISRISVDSFYSQVLLTGEVPDEQIKSQVVALVRSMPDVRQVYDELTVAPNRGYSSTLQDGYITSKFMAKVLANQSVKSSQVKAVTDNGVVYIMGRMTPTQQSHLVNIANQTVGITELVLLTTLVSDTGAVLSSADVMQETNLEAPNSQGLGTSAPVNRRSIMINHNAPATPSQALPTVSAPSYSPVTPAASATTSQETSPYIELYKDQVQP